jgi:predicted DCC family thiol-disulfide oxidoreductase YuxK
VHDTLTHPTETDTRTSSRPYTLVYDGACRVCNRFVRLLRRWDARHQVETVPSQDLRVAARFPWIPAAAYADAVQLVGPGGRTWEGAAAIEELLTVLPRGWLLGWIFKLPFVGRLADKFYRWFARNRYRFGCGEHCQYRRPRTGLGEPAA